MAGLYDGMAGLTAAWARWRYWINVELPDQWNQLAALYAQLGGSGVSSEATAGSGPIPPPADPFAAWRVDVLSPSDQTLAHTLANNWIALWNTFHAPVSLGAWTNWLGSPTPAIAAVLLDGWRVWRLADGTVRVAPADYSFPASAGAVEWIIGTPGGRT